MLTHARRTAVKAARRVGRVLMTRRNRAASSPDTAKREKKWIGKVIRRKGALRATVNARYGTRGFDREGRIKPEVLRKLSRAPGKTGKRARLAMELRRYR